jgi:hypothetical protein
MVISLIDLNFQVGKLTAAVSCWPIFAEIDVLVSDNWKRLGARARLWPVTSFVK